MTDAQTKGCEVYGLRLTGVGGTGLLADSGGNRPRMAVRHDGHERDTVCVGTQRAVLDLPEGRQVCLLRSHRTATFCGPPLHPDELVHPYLGAATSIFNRWAGREVFHAGAFVAGGRAWAVVGRREAGKSSLLAALSARGMAILADDLVVTDGRMAFCGPRTIDLRSPSPGLTAPMTPSRGESRWRLQLPALPGEVPLGGWIYLRWQEAVCMPTIPASVLLARLVAGRSWAALPSDPETLLALAALSAWDLGRPADWTRMDETVDLMLETLPVDADQRSQISTSPAVAHRSRKSSTSTPAALAVRPKAVTSAAARSSTVAQSPSRSQSSAPDALSP